MYNKFSSLFLLLFFAIIRLLSGCDNKSIHDPVTYFRFVLNKRNGLFQEQTVGNYTFSLQYKSSTYMVLTDNENFPLNPESFVQQENEYSKNQYYTFRIKIAPDTENLDILTYNLNSEQEYNDRIHYLEKGMRNDIYLVCGKDTSKASSFIYDKSSDLNNCSSFLITFPISQNMDSDRKFVFCDKKFQSGIILFTITGETIKNTPPFRL